MTVDLYRFLIVLCLGVIGASWFLVHQRARGHEEGRRLEFVIGTSWFLVLAFAFENLAVTIEQKIFWDGIQLGFDGLFAASYVLFAARYAGRRPRREGWLLASLVAAPAVASLIMATSPWHGLTRTGAKLIHDPMLRLWYPFEALDYLVFLVMYSTFFVAIGIFVYSGFLQHRAYRRQAIALVFGVAIPASSVFVVGHVSILGERDLSPFLFAAAACVNVFAVLETRIFKLAPLARDFLIERLGDAMIVVDREGMVVDANRAARPFFSEGSAVGRSLVLVWPSGAERLPTNGEGFRVPVDDRVWEMRRYPLDDGGELLVGRDVTTLAHSEAELERANVELESRVLLRTKELRESNEHALANERKFRAIFDNAHQTIVLLDADGRILAVNLTGLEIVGLLAEDLVGKSLEDTPFWRNSESARAEFPEAWTAALAGRFSRFEIVFDEARLIYLDCSLKPILRDGRVEVVLFEAHDISLVRQAERERAQMMAETQHAERMRMLGRLAGGVAHDFNNLITVMMAGASVLRTRVSSDELAHQVLDDVDHVTESASLVTRQLLAFSRPEVGRVEPTDVHDVISRMKKVMQRLLGERHELRLELGAERSFVLIDGTQLERCLMNLVVNARDAMPDGGPIFVRTRVEDRRTREQGSGEAVVIAVQDHGQGMSDEVRSRVFEAFFTTKPAGQGTGLGLANVQQIVTSARGSVHLESELGQGTTFEIFLPLCDPKRTSDAAPSDEAVTGSETIVLVEDVASLRELMGRELRRLGYDVHSFASAEQAKKGLEGQDVTPSLLVTDVILPGQSGVDLARELAPTFPRMKIVFTTGYSGETSLEEAARDPSRRVLYKPYPPTTLAMTIRALLDADEREVE